MARAFEQVAPAHRHDGDVHEHEPDRAGDRERRQLVDLAPGRAEVDLAQEEPEKGRGDDGAEDEPDEWAPRPSHRASIHTVGDGKLRAMAEAAALLDSARGRDRPRRLRASTSARGRSSSARGGRERGRPKRRAARRARAQARPARRAGAPAGAPAADATGGRAERRLRDAERRAHGRLAHAPPSAARSGLPPASAARRSWRRSAPSRSSSSSRSRRRARSRASSTRSRR